MIKGGRVLPECHGVVGTPRQACGHVESGKKKGTRDKFGWRGGTAAHGGGAHPHV